MPKIMQETMARVRQKHKDTMQEKKKKVRFYGGQYLYVLFT